MGDPEPIRAERAAPGEYILAADTMGVGLRFFYRDSVYEVVGSLASGAPPGTRPSRSPRASSQAPGSTPCSTRASGGTDSPPPDASPSVLG
jgi:hypothetical protein